MQVTTPQMCSPLPSGAPARAARDLWPSDRVTLTAEARAGTGSSPPVPRSDVRWYRPRGEAAVRQCGSGTRFAGSVEPAGRGQRHHAAVARYLRMMALAA